MVMAKDGKFRGSERRKQSTTDQLRSQFVYTSTWSADANSLTDRPRCSGRSQGARTVERGDVGRRLLGVTTHEAPTPRSVQAKAKMLVTRSSFATTTAAGTVVALA